MNNGTTKWLDDEDECFCDDCYDEHTCPFKVEINDDSEFTCTCCSVCEYNCAMEV